MSVAKFAAEDFAEYAGMDTGELPSARVPLAALQVELARWQAQNFGAPTAEQLALGVSEESGELCHAVLKRAQGIRGMDDQGAYLEAVADALADIAIYSMQMATLHRLDYATLLCEVAEKVMKRDWQQNVKDGEQ